MSINLCGQGTVIASSVKRSWGVTRNFVPYNCGNTPINSSVQYFFYGGQNYLYNALKDQDVFTATRTGYHYRMTGDRVIGQRIPNLIKGHYYYFGVWVKQNSGSSSIVVRNGTTDLTWLPITQDGNWHWCSKVFYVGSNVSAGSYDLSSGANFAVWVASGVTIYFTRIILFDITNALGAPIVNTMNTTYGWNVYNGTSTTSGDTDYYKWREWVDNTCREVRTLACADADTDINYTTGGLWIGTPSGWNSTPTVHSDYFATSATINNSVAYPWGCYLECTTSSSYVEHFLLSSNNYSPSTSYTYYMSIYGDQHNATGYGMNNEFFVSAVGGNNTPTVSTTSTNSSHGGMRIWKKISGLIKPSSTSSNKIRFDLNNPSKVASKTCYYTPGFFEFADDLVSKYNSTFGTSLTVNTIGTAANEGRHFYDCWFDAGYQPIIHLPSPMKGESVHFNPDQIICNDVLIEPQINKTYIDKYGRLHCKSLYCSDCFV